METGSSYVYFAFKGDSFDTDEVTNRLGITPTDSWRKGDKGFYKSAVEFAMWRLSPCYNAIPLRGDECYCC